MQWLKLSVVRRTFRFTRITVPIIVVVPLGPRASPRLAAQIEMEAVGMGMELLLMEYHLLER